METALYAAKTLLMGKASYGANLNAAKFTIKGVSTRGWRQTSRLKRAHIGKSFSCCKLKKFAHHPVHSRADWIEWMGRLGLFFML